MTCDGHLCSMTLWTAIVFVCIPLAMSVDCPLGTVMCPHSQRCLNDTSKCERVKDCQEGTDDIYCRDPNQDKLWNLIFKKRPDADRHNQKDVCSLLSIPSECLCKEWTRLYCTNAGLTEIPQSLPSGTTILDLSGNHISSIYSTSLKNLTHLKEIMIRQNSLEFLQEQAFPAENQLTKVYLQNNRIRFIHPETFAYNNSIEELWLGYNRLKVLTAGMFTRLHSLTSLYLDNNQITKIDQLALSINGLQILFLSDNALEHIDNMMFSKLVNLLDLNLSGNRIKAIDNAAFAAMSDLFGLMLAKNDLRHIKRTFFEGLGELSFLKDYMVILLTDALSRADNFPGIFVDIRRNRIRTIDIDAFEPLKNLKSLEIKDNLFRKLPIQTIGRLPHLKYVYFDEFYMCAFAPQARYCEPLGDGISSQHNLLENSFLRVAVWIVAVLACVGNTLVLLGRFLLREDNQIHSFYIKNLSLADMLMGIYLLVIGSRDVMYRGHYLRHDNEWRTSWECDVCGIISTMSSEVSVLTIGLITFDRYISIMYPFYHRKKNMKLAYIIILVIWSTCLLIAVLPVTGLAYFGDAFYGDNGVCVPLQLHNPKAKGWQYSTFLFLGLNLLSFILICYAYIVMFIAIKQSTTLLRSTSKCQDTLFVKRFFLIVVTDFVCWVPIMTMKALALADVEISGDFYAWLVVFILPVNSALNPLLYTLTTRLFKKKLISSLCINICGRKSGRSASNNLARPLHVYRPSAHNSSNAVLTSHMDDRLNGKNKPSCQLLTKHRKEPIRTVNFRRPRIEDRAHNSNRSSLISSGVVGGLIGHPASTLSSTTSHTDV